MTALAAPGRATGGDLLVWGAAGAAALAAHAALAGFLLREPPPIASQPAPAAVMLELAPAPTAPEASETQIAPDVVDQHEVLETPAAMAAPPEPSVADLAPPDPLTPPDIAEPVEDVLPPVDTTPVEVAAAVTRPLARPESLPRPPEPAPERVERRQAEKRPPQVARQAARAEAPPAAKAAAPQNSRGAAGAMSPATWQSRLMARLERAKRYPSGARRRGEEGVAYVSFAIAGDGRVLSAQLARSSGHSELDQEVLALVRRASPLPPPPPGAPTTITAPVRFNIR
jgi:protein TonB